MSRPPQTSLVGCPPGRPAGTGSFLPVLTSIRGPSERLQAFGIRVRDAESLTPVLVQGGQVTVSGSGGAYDSCSAVGASIVPGVVTFACPRVGTGRTTFTFTAPGVHSLTVQH
jgi:hypothetical protein